MIVRAVIAMLLAQGAPAAPTDDLASRSKAAIDTAYEQIQGGHPQAAYDLLTPIVAAHEAANAADKRMIFCGMSLSESLLYMTMAGAAKREGVAIAPDYCQALFLQGFALVDLGRLADARATYRRVVALAPMHAHYLAELGLTYRFDKDWKTMRETCAKAENAVGFAAEDEQKREQGIAMRCQGFALIELGKFDDAEKMFVRCIKLDPADEKAKSELTYIQRQRLDRKGS